MDENEDKPIIPAWRSRITIPSTHTLVLSIFGAAAFSLGFNDLATWKQIICFGFDFIIAGASLICLRAIHQQNRAGIGKTILD